MRLWTRLYGMCKGSDPYVVIPIPISCNYIQPYLSQILWDWWNSFVLEIFWPTRVEEKKKEKTKKRDFVKPFDLNDNSAYARLTVYM